MNNRTEAPKAAATTRPEPSVPMCVRQGCGKPALLDAYCSRKCVEADHGLSMAADLGHGGTAPAEVTKMRTLGGAALAVTRLQREAVARDLEARARVSREDRAGRYSRLEAGQ